MKINEILTRLSKSKFRSSFHLRKYMIKYIDDKGLDTIKEHTYDFIKTRLAPSNPINDGKQTPTKGHPTFIAQHATATCCRSCLEKWYHVPKNVELNEKQINALVGIIMKWIEKEYKK